MPKAKVAVVIPNLNGARDLRSCLDSLSAQTGHPQIVLVDNGSSDNSVEVARSYPGTVVIKHEKNLGFSGGVNAGIRWAIDNGFELVALFNNDASADPRWLEHLTKALENPKVGIVTGKILDKKNRSHFDSTGEFYTSWGVPFPRGRGEIDNGQFDTSGKVFGASGGASLYRTRMFKEIGLFDEDFFAYYEDVDLSFRAQLASWQVVYEPRAIVYHAIGQTSGQIPGFTTYQAMKNLPLLFWKNVPAVLLPRIFLRFSLAYVLFYFSAVARGQFWPASKGLIVSIGLLPKKLWQRQLVQRRKKVSNNYIRSIIVHDLPPSAGRLRKIRKIASLGVSQ